MTLAALLVAVAGLGGTGQVDFPPCPAAARHCVGVTLHVAHDDAGKPLVDARWIAGQLRHANLLFADVGLGFEVAAVGPLSAREAHVASRRDRDRLGRKRFARGTVHVFLVNHLANVDAPGVIRGVHWRDRGDVARRWVILADYAMTWVLAHELGHFFGLPHSRYRISVMNKRSRKRPPAMERRFATPERKRLRVQLRRQLAEGMVQDRAAGRKGRRSE